ncbi:hypothetical protein ACHAWF_009623, partial [Thalassiosira exigua]
MTNNINRRTIYKVPSQNGTAATSPTIHQKCGRACFLHAEGSKPITIVMGSNTSIGFETATGLVERDYHASATDADEHYVQGGTALFLRPLDLSSFTSVRSFCEAFCRELCEQYDSLNVLPNNARIKTLGNKTTKTEGGLNVAFKSNLVRYFFLTELLFKHLRHTKNKYAAEASMDEEAGRIMSLSSATNHFAPDYECEEI